MRNWKTISLFVCVFAFARELRPIEPFYSAYMTSPAVNITLEQVNITDYLKYGLRVFTVHSKSLKNIRLNQSYFLNIFCFKR